MSKKKPAVEPDEALLPQPAQAHDGCRLLQEYLAMPARFLFVDIGGLAEGAGLGSARAVDLLFALTAAPAAGTRVQPDDFRLGCTPIVNLFRCTSEPIRLDLTRLEHRLEADARRPCTVEIHSIEEVATSNESSVFGTGNAAALSRLTTLDASRAASSVSTRVRSTSCGVQRCVLAVIRTSGALRRMAASFSRRSPASRSASSGGTDGGATGLAVVIGDCVVTRSPHHR